VSSLSSGISLFFLKTFFRTCNAMWNVNEFPYLTIEKEIFTLECGKFRYKWKKTFDLYFHFHSCCSSLVCLKLAQCPSNLKQAQAVKMKIIIEKSIEKLTFNLFTWFARSRKENIQKTKVVLFSVKSYSLLSSFNLIGMKNWLNFLTYLFTFSSSNLQITLS